MELELLTDEARSSLLSILARPKSPAIPKMIPNPTNQIQHSSTSHNTH